MKAFTASVLLIFGTIAAAQEREFYGGIGGGGTNFESSAIDIALPVDPASTVTAVLDDSDSNLRIYGGYRLNRNLAFEALYSDIGEFELIDDANNFVFRF